MTKPDWLRRLEVPSENAHFSQTAHDYYKLASMRIMQEMRERHNVPPDDVPTLMIACFARLLNEAVYSIGAQIQAGMDITEIYEKGHLLNLVKVLNGEPLNARERTDLSLELEDQLNHFKRFIMEKAKDFYTND